MMGSRIGLLLILSIIGLSIACGCTTASIGNVRYQDGRLFIRATNDNPTTLAVLQVSVDQIKDFQQSNVFRKAEYIEFRSGTSEYEVPVSLEPGSYKVYIYIYVDGDSKARVIRDLVVE